MIPLVSSSSTTAWVAKRGVQMASRGWRTLTNKPASRPRRAAARGLDADQPISTSELTLQIAADAMRLGQATYKK
jgi:hypothetical protein